jgi:hypothetical protein
MKSARLLPSLVLLAAAGCPAVAEDVSAPTQEFLDQKAELEGMLAKRDLELFEVSFDPIALDRIIITDRLGVSRSVAYLAFRIRNQISAGSATPISQAKGYNEVLDAIVQQYEQAKVAKDNGVALTIDGVEGKDGVIIERNDARTGTRALDLSFLITDEHGTRQHLLEDPTAPGAQNTFAFADLGDSRQSSVSGHVRDRIEETLGRKLLTLDEIRATSMAPYDATQRGEHGWAAGELYGVALFSDLPAHGNRYTIHVRGLTNKFRIRWAAGEPGKPENYLDTVFYRRTYTLEYTSIGDEHYKAEDHLTLAKAGWEWLPTFQRNEQRRMQAYVRHYLDNIATPGTEQVDKDVEREAWEWYNAHRTATPERSEKLPDLQSQIKVAE